MADRSDQHVLVGMSGGVDSSVAAHLLLEQGYRVTGAFLDMGHAAHEGEGATCSSEDVHDAQQVADTFGIELHVVDASAAFAPVIDDFIREYVAARTPNPCVRCNIGVKFGRMVELADALGAGSIATGHYARVREIDGQRRVMRGAAIAKDQSYVLFGINPTVRQRLVLPIGEFEEKAQVRELARGLGLSVHDKPDSQEICFVPDDDYVAFLAERAPEAMKGGRILSTAGDVLGEHEGYARYTIGQRRGLGVACGHPMYVVKIDADSGDVTLGNREESCTRTLTASECVWHVEPPAESFDAMVQIRYNHRGALAKVTPLPDGRFAAEFAEPVHAITPGQAAVIYQDQTLLAGGWIE